MIYYKPEKIACHFTMDIFYFILYAEHNHLIHPFTEFYELLLKDFLKFSLYNNYHKSQLDAYPHIKYKRL